MQPDELNRKPLAVTIWNLIKNNPMEGSTRIGVYGAWGEGKTTVLEFVHDLARAEKHPIVRFNPWIAQDPIHLWSSLYSAILETCPDSEAPVKGTLKEWSAKLSRMASKLPYIDKFIEKLPDLSLAFMLDRIRSEMLERLSHLPETAKIVVLIDDLDRANPKLVTHLLLGLLEELNLSRCAYVVGLDPMIIAKALPAVHPGWGTTAEFLEKILEFRFWLPRPQKADVIRLCEAEVQLSPFRLELRSFHEIINVLPSNPRKLKQFFRGLWRLKPLIDRHKPEEIHWNQLLLLEYLRTLSFEVFQVLVDTPTFWDELLASSFRARESLESDTTAIGEEKWIAELDAATEGSDVGDERARAQLRKNLTRFFNTFRDFVGPEHFVNTRYFARLSEEPPALTWKEYEALIVKWKTDPSPTRLDTLVSDQVRQVSSTREKCVKELWTMTLRSRENALSQAAQCTTQTEQQGHLKDAEDALRLLELAAHDLKAFAFPGRPLDSSDYLLLYKHCSGWAHFAVPVEVYSDVRNAEQSLLIRTAQECRHSSGEIVEELEPWDDSGWPHRQVQVLKEAVIEAFVPPIVDELHARFSIKGGIHTLWPRDQHHVEKYYLLRRESGFYSLTGIENLRVLSEQAREKIHVQENFVEYLRLIDYGLHNKLGIVSASEVTALAKDKKVIKMAWKAVVANPLQLRIVGSLRDTRAVLAETAESDEHLPLPSWWDTAR